MRALKINRLLPVYISIVPLKFGVDIQSQTKVRVRKPKNPIWLPDGHFEINIAENQLAPTHIHLKVLCYLILELIFKAKLKLESGNKKIQYGHQAAILQVTSLKINRLLPMITINMHMKFEIEIPKQTWLTLWKPCHLQRPETEKSNMAARRPFWKWRCWKSIGSYPYT